MKIIDKPFEAPQADGFEVTLRHIMCVFMTFETMFIIGIIIMLIDTDTIILLKYHEESLSIILFPFMLCAFLIGMTILSFFHKHIYLIYEGLHVIIGIWALISLLTGAFIFIFVFIIFSLRFTVYLIIMEIHNTRLEKRKRQSESRDL